MQKAVSKHTLPQLCQNTPFCTAMIAPNKTNINGIVIFSTPRISPN